VHRSHDFDLHVLETLQQHWPLDCRSPFPEHAV
jgi:hypothetical protein